MCCTEFDFVDVIVLQRKHGSTCSHKVFMIKCQIVIVCISSFIYTCPACGDSRTLWWRQKICCVCTEVLI